MQLIYKRSIYYYNLGHSDDAKLKELYFDDYEKRWQGSINHINTIWHDVETNENIKDVISIETDTVTYEESSIHEYMPMEEGKHFGNEIIFLDSDFEKMRNL